MSVTIVAPLRLADAVDISACGGKAANLARLIVSGAPVPDGFVLTTEALRLRAAPPLHTRCGMRRSVTPGSATGIR